MARKGDWYETRQSIEVTVWLAVGAPVSLFGAGTLAAGEMLIVTDEKDVYGKICCRPQRYHELEDTFVSPDERKSVSEAYAKYEGYFLLIPADMLATHCQRVVWDEPPQG